MDEALEFSYSGSSESDQDLSFPAMTSKEQDLYNACKSGDIEKVNSIVRGGGVDINWANPNMV